MYIVVVAMSNIGENMSFSVDKRSTWRIGYVRGEQQGELHLLNAGFIRDLDNWKVPESIQNFWVLWYNFTSGAVCFSGGKSYELTPEKIILIPPHTPYSGKLNHPVPHFFIWFQAYSPFDAPENRIVEISAEPYLKQLEAATRFDERTSMRLKSLIGCLLLDIPEKFFQTPQSRNSKIVEQALSFIITNNGKVSNEEISGHLHLSSSRFSHLFKEELGVSPQRYCLQVRMSHADKLLLQNFPIEQTAEICGFADRFHFSKEFKKYHGISPAKWLKQFEKLLAEK